MKSLALKEAGFYWYIERADMPFEIVLVVDGLSERVFLKAGEATEHRAESLSGEFVGPLSPPVVARQFDGMGYSPFASVD